MFRMTNAAEAERQRRDLTRDAVPVVEWCRIVTAQAPTTWLPAVRLDCRQRPDIIDLARVHKLERCEGDLTSQWTIIVDPAGVVTLYSLAIAFSSPARCTFTLALTPGHRMLLEAIAVSGQLGITHQPLQRADCGIVAGVSIGPLRTALAMQAIGDALT